jgi:hypothetical protein
VLITSIYKRDTRIEIFEENILQAINWNDVVLFFVKLIQMPDELKSCII